MRKTSPATASKTQGPQPATSVAHSAAGAVRSCAARREHADGETRSREADHRGPAARQTSPGHALMSYTQLLPASGPPASASSFPRTLGGIPRRVQSYSPHKASGRLDCGIPVLWGANLYWATLLFRVAEASAACGLLQGRPGSAPLLAAIATGSGSQGIVFWHPVCGPGADLVGQAGSRHKASAACGLLQGRPGSASRLAAIRCWLGFAGDCP